MRRFLSALQGEFGSTNPGGRLERVKAILWGTALQLDDPVFGLLFTQRFKQEPSEGDVLDWEAHANRDGVDLLQIPGARFNCLEDVLITAGPKGPTDEQRRGWRLFVENYTTIETILIAKIHENYLWHADGGTLSDDQASYASAEEAFADPSFDRWSVYIRESALLDFRLQTPWHLDHSFALQVRDGQVEYAGQE